ncbi:MAG: IgGFc-binding protein [Bacteroidales bacterium]
MAFLNSVKGQSDTLFWFAAPDVSSSHADRPIFLRLASFGQSSAVTIDQPANSSFAPINITVPANGTSSVNLTALIDLIENPVLNNDTIFNRGLRIRSNHIITAYYEVHNPLNPEIFVLKGRNALGTNFMIPSQTLVSNKYNENSFVIVATENNTLVTITPSKDLYLSGFFIHHLANTPFTITLNKGQSISFKATSFSPNEHLAGTVVVSNKPIAITICDDSAVGDPPWNGPCYDLLGDQLIPINVIGKEYIIAKGFLNGNDRVFAMAVSDNTNIYINGSTTPSYTKNSKQTQIIIIDSNYTYISADKPIYMTHLSGFGCELGMPVLPPIYCTGSTSVAFTRSDTTFFGIIIITRNGCQSGFTLNNNSTLIQSSNFSVVPNTGSQWVAARINMSANVGTGSGNIISNNLGSFHFGIINGAQDFGCRYGYFSDYSMLNLGPDITKCLLDTAILDAGPEKDSYSWSTGATTQTIKVTKDTTYSVTITKGSCVITDTIIVTNKSHPLFAVTSSDNTICLGGSATLTVNGTSTFLWSGGYGKTNPLIVTPSVTTNYKVYDTISGCIDTANYVITVIPVPVGKTDTISICNDHNTNYTITTLNNVLCNFAWTIGTVTGGITGASAGSGILINQPLHNPGSTTSGSVQYIVTPTSLSGSCVGLSFIIKVNVFPIPNTSNIFHD